MKTVKQTARDGEAQSTLPRLWDEQLAQLAADVSVGVIVDRFCQQ